MAVTCGTVPIVAANGHTTQVLLLTSLLRPAATRQAGIIAQGFALAGTFVGVTLLLTVGPRTTLDIVIHLFVVIMLVIGLLITVRAPRTVSEQVTTGI